MNNRRDFLKYFSIGATVIPVLNGMPKLDAEAKLIETPRVAIQPATEMSKGSPYDIIHGAQPHQILVVLVDPSGKRYTFQASTFVTSMQAQVIDVTNLPSADNDQWRQKIVGLSEVGWKLEGFLREGWETAFINR